MAAPHAGPVTSEKYLQAERLSDRRHELVNGVVHAISEASVAHVRLVGNLYFHLRRLLSEGCEVFMNDTRVGIRNAYLYTYPDLSIVYGEPAFEKAQFDTLTNPIVLVEVFFPSTMAYDRGKKFLHYQKIPFLKAYVPVAQDAALVECLVRTEEGGWLHHVAPGREAEIEIPPLGMRLSLEAVYEGVEIVDDASKVDPTP